MGAYLVKFPRSRIVTLVPIFIFITTTEIPAWVMLIWWFIIQIFSGFGSLATADYTGGGVAWFAHIGGFIGGFLAGAIASGQLMADRKSTRLNSIHVALSRMPSSA